MKRKLLSYLYYAVILAALFPGCGKETPTPEELNQNISAEVQVDDTKENRPIKKIRQTKKNRPIQMINLRKNLQIILIVKQKE